MDAQTELTTLCARAIERLASAIMYPTVCRRDVEEALILVNDALIPARKIDPEEEVA